MQLILLYCSILHCIIENIYLLCEYSSPICGGYSSSQSTASSSRRTTMWHSRSPRRALFTINGSIKSSRNTSNWQRAPSLDNSCNNPPAISFTIVSRSLQHWENSTVNRYIQLTQILTFYSTRVERYEKIVARLSQFLYRYRGWTAYNTTFVVFENRAKYRGWYTISDLVLATLVLLSKFDAGTEHTTEHRVWVGCKESWVQDESEKSKF